MTCSVPENDGRISILEKISRLTEVFDPSLMPIDLVQFYASNLGYSVGLNRDNIKSNVGEYNVNVVSDDEEYNTDVVSEIEQNKYLRFVVSQLPEWYKVKTSRPSVQVMLYSFGLVGDLVYYYTNNYASDTGAAPDTTIDADDKQASDRLNKMQYASFKEMYDDLCVLKYNLDTFKSKLENNWQLTLWNPTSIKEDPSNIPDMFYPTPHFRLWFDVLQSISALTYSSDLDRQEQIVVAINSIRPINTVFEGMIAAMSVTATEYIVPYIRTATNLSIISDVPADQWATLS